MRFHIFLTFGFSMACKSELIAHALISQQVERKNTAIGLTWPAHWDIICSPQFETRSCAQKVIEE